MVNLLDGEKTSLINDDSAAENEENNESLDREEEINKESKKPNKKKKNEEKIATIYDQPVHKADINRYNDLSGLSMSKLGLGLWFVENRKSMITLGYGILIIIGVLTWANFFYHFGYYFIVGMRNDDQMVVDLINTTTVGHDYTLNSAARDLMLDPIEVLRLGTNRFDLVAKITNPNINHWAEFTYAFKISDNEYGEASSFILPGEVKFLSALAVEPIGGMDNSIRLYLDDLTWHRVDRHIYPDWTAFRDDHMDITTTDVVFTPAKATNLSEKMSLNELKFTVNNNTDYNYWRVELLILLYNRNRIIGVDRYVLDEFNSDESRLIRSTWPGTIGAVHDVEIIPELNITRDDIYMKFEGGTPIIQ